MTAGTALAGSDTVRLAGCRVEPLGSYLKALGLFRLVATQAEPGALGWWESDAFVLRSQVDSGGLVELLLDRYRPTPVVCPWSKGSGFYPKDQQAGIAALEESTTDRLVHYRAALAGARGLLRRVDPELTGDKALKDQILALARSELPDQAVEWIDAAVVLASDHPVYPPLLGTGGNDGRLDFSNNFMQRLRTVLSLTPGSRAPSRSTLEAWVRGSLFGIPVVGEKDRAVGQFDPAAAGSPSTGWRGETPSILNPWDFVLMVEGSLAFAGNTARRLGSRSSLGAVPFTCRSSSLGYPSAAGGEGARGELWAPVWEHPTPYGEIAHLMAEGRCEWDGGQARSGLEMVKAVASLGMERGIGGFVRHAFVERSGLSYLAVPVDRVRRDSLGELEPDFAASLARLDRWMARVASVTDAPAAVRSAVRRFEQAEYRFVRHRGHSVATVLDAAAQVELAVGQARRSKSLSHIPPVGGLRAAAWLGRIDRSSVEGRLALALASRRDERGGHVVRCLRYLLRPVALRDRDRRQRGLAWTDDVLVGGFLRAPLAQVLADAHVRRVMEVTGTHDTDRGPTYVVPEPRIGVSTAAEWAVPAPLADVELMLEDRVDWGLLARRLSGLLLLDWSHAGGLPPSDDPSSEGSLGSVEGGSVQILYSLLAPFFGRGDVITPTGRVPVATRRPVRVTLAPEPRWPGMLRAGALGDVDAAARRRLAMAGLGAVARPVFSNRTLASAGRRLSSALLVPVSPPDRSRALCRVCPPPVPRNPGVLGETR